MDKAVQIPIGPSERESKGSTWRRGIFINKLNHPAVIGLLVLLSAGIVAAIAKFGMIAGVLALGAMVGLPMVYAIVAYPRLGIFVYLGLAYIIMWFFKMGVNFPLGTLMDGMEGLFILSVFINQRTSRDWSLFKGPVSTMMLVWVVYNLLEVANPVAESRIAWLYTVRTVAVVMFMYFIFIYYIDSKKLIRALMKLWIGLACFAALYAFKQQHIGFFPFEESFLHSDPNIELLLFIGGVWRKFSIFSDPVAFAYNMVTASLLCVGLISGPIARYKKIVLSCMVVLFLTAMLYSGTRGAYVLIPAAALLLVVLKFNKKLIAIAAIAAAALVVIIFIPTSNQTLYRFQSAFKPSDDASFNVRKMNQKRIQPYILSHPMGGGLGSTGEWGQRFAPNSYLAHFPPDSGYVRVAVELGYIGLLLFCILMFTILRTGINNYYRIKDPELKSYCLAAVLIVFALNIGNYPQEALVQYPSNVYFYLVVALITVTLRLDKKQNEISDASN
jgi:putative inorganic carbon (HCO3(-)) transporter